MKSLWFSIVIAALIGGAGAAGGGSDAAAGGSHARLAAGGGANPWAGHPALESFEIGGQTLPLELFLVRTRGEMPGVDGVTVHAARGGLFLVSGDPTAVLALAERGCGVTALEPVLPARRAPERTWTRLDAPDPATAAMVAEVDSAGVFAKIQWLVDFGTRYSYASNHFAVAGAIGDVFEGYGLTPVLSSFQYNGATMWNVEAVQTGAVYPDSFFIICGHFDSWSETPMTSAPGADDNGTGVATVLTAAEILTRHDFEYSIRYVCFGGEEQGLRGSKAYAAWADEQDLGIAGVLNFDMMGYWEPGVEMDLEIETNQASQWLAAAVVDAATLYTDAPYELHVYDGAWWGDHASFWAKGYAAVNHEEAWDWVDPDFNPYYHTTNDVLAHVGAAFMVGNVRIAVASLSTLARLVPEGTGIGERAVPPAFAGTLRARPNPFVGRVTFTVNGLTDHASARVIIYDALGRYVDAVPVTLSGGGGSASWLVNNGPLREIVAGVYFAKLEGLPGARVVKIVCVQ